MGGRGSPSEAVMANATTKHGGHDSPRDARNAAFVEAMVLAASSDGQVSQRELETLLMRVLERPEFDGTDPEALNRLVERSIARLAGAKSVDEVLGSLRDRLPAHEQRLLAFGLATAVAFADDRATREELGLLKALQAGLGISEDEVVRIVDIVESGGSLDEMFGLPAARLYTEVMVLMSAVDGTVQEAEAAELVMAFLTDPEFDGVSPETAQEWASTAIAGVVAQGLPQRLHALALGLKTPDERRNAYRFAAKVAQSHGGVDKDEAQLLQLLQATLGLDDGEVRKLSK